MLAGAYAYGWGPLRAPGNSGAWRCYHLLSRALQILSKAKAREVEEAMRGREEDLQEKRGGKHAGAGGERHAGAVFDGKTKVVDGVDV